MNRTKERAGTGDGAAEEAGCRRRRHRAPLTDEQKSEIAEVRKTYAAKLAQEEILHKSKLVASADFEERATIDEHYRRDVERLNHERDRKIEKIRNA